MAKKTTTPRDRIDPTLIPERIATSTGTQLSKEIRRYGRAVSPRNVELKLDELNHIYSRKDKDGNWQELNWISVSRIVSRCFPNDFSDIPYFVLKRAQERGNCVHSRIAEYISRTYSINEWSISVDEALDLEISPCSCGVKTDAHNKNSVFLKIAVDDFYEEQDPSDDLETLVEYSICSDTWEFVGQLDWCIINHSQQLIHLKDHKTTSAKHEDREFAQLYLYSLGLLEMRPELAGYKWKFSINNSNLQEVYYPLDDGHYPAKSIDSGLNNTQKAVKTAVLRELTALKALNELF